MPGQDSNSGLIVGIISLLLGAGGVAFFRTLFGGVSTLRSGAIAREREAVEAVGRARDDADRGRAEAERRLRVKNRDLDYSQRVCAQYAAQLIRAGITPIPAELILPSESDPQR